MKSNFIKALAITALLASCSEDDVVVENPNPPIDTPGEVSVVLNEVEYLGNRVEIFNNGEEAVDLDGYFLCLAPGTYRQIGALETVGNVNLQPGEYLSVSYEMPNAEGGLGLYRNNAGFGDAANIADFVQWGAAGAVRENVAVDAGIWTAGEFVPVMGDENNSIIFDGEGTGASNWAETTTVTIGAENVLTMPAELRASIVLNEVQYGNLDQVEIYNNGDVTVDLSSYWLCLGPGQYAQIGSIVPVSGSVELPAGEFLVLPFNMSDSEGLGLYSTNTFASADAIVDFVQWGEAGSARENVAAEAGIWTAGEFVPVVGQSASIEYDGEGDAASDWAEEAIPSLGEANDAVARTTTFNITITNAAEIFNVHTFSERIRNSVNEGAGPLTQNGDQYKISFKAVPGTKFTPITMMGNSNDWFLAPEDLAGIPLWDENGAPLNGVDIANELVLYDLGTEADNIPAAFPPAGANVGDADPNTTIRLVDRAGRRGDTYMTAVLDYAEGVNEAGTFTFTITTLMAPNPAQPASSENGFVVTPGIVALHANNAPLFDLGEEDRGEGLEAIAEDGMPGELFSFYREEGDSGFLRLTSTRTVFSPGVVYAFNGERDPFVLQGEVNNPANGLEEIAEDGNNAVALEYLQSIGIPVAASDQTSNVGPGESLTFSLTVPEGQGFKFGFATMFVDTNDWFIAYNNAGYPLWDENGTPASGFGASEKSYLFDSGTEIDQLTGFGENQAPRQGARDTGAEDPNNIVRRVGPSNGTFLTDAQFGKGAYDNPAGVIYVGDPRGGYNAVKVEIQPQ
ncbi:spondin domain-containing protein [Maribacter sp. 2210JD10-5]|uniref:spondin domain-containing protein n=1 Tax=Maribacter sp. 2210JD10-5 TaxID=3386272 RepID=UPI0039BCF4C0